MMHAPARLPHSQTRLPFPEPHLSRRNFTRYGLFSLLGAVAATSAVATLRSLYPTKIAPSGASVSLGSVADVRKRLADERYLRNIIGRFYLLSAENDRVIAVSWICTNLPFMVHNFDGLFMRCPFCDARYNGKTGVVENERAPRPLDFMPITIVEGNVIVHADQITKRAAYDRSQSTLLN